MKGFFEYFIAFLISYIIMYIFYRQIKINNLIENKKNRALIFQVVLFILSNIGLSISDSFAFGAKYHHVFMGIIMAPTIAFIPFVILCNKSKR